MNGENRQMVLVKLILAACGNSFKLAAFYKLLGFDVFLCSSYLNTCSSGALGLARSCH